MEKTDFDFRQEKLTKEIEPIFKKYQIALGTKINYTDSAIIPQVVFVDMTNSNVVESDIKSDRSAQISKTESKKTK